VARAFKQYDITVFREIVFRMMMSRRREERNLFMYIYICIRVLEYKENITVLRNTIRTKRTLSVRAHPVTLSIVNASV